MNAKIKVILADDHPIVRQGLRQVIENEPDLIVAAECGDGPETLVAVALHNPDVVILDVDMPEQTGFDVLRRLNEQGSTCRAIFLTVHGEAEFFHEARRLGAAAYILKECAVEEIVPTIRRVVGGADEYLFSERLNQLLARRSDQTTVGRLSSLTPTEREVLKLLAEYKTTKEIAAELFISPLTVKTHRRNVCAKLEIEGTNGLVRFALENKSLL